MLRQVDGEVERRLPAECRQQHIGAFLLNNLLDDIGGDRFDIRPIGEAGVGHDSCWIGIDQNDSITLFFECLQCLGARIIEFASLADNDWPGTDEKNGFDVSAFGHGLLLHAVLSHQIHETTKQIIRVVGTRRRFGMILHRKNGQFPVR